MPCSRTFAPSWSARRLSKPAPGPEREPAGGGRNSPSRGPQHRRCLRIANERPHNGCMNLRSRRLRHCSRHSGHTLDAFVQIGLRLSRPQIAPPARSRAAKRNASVDPATSARRSRTSPTSLTSQPLACTPTRGIAHMNQLLRNCATRATRCWWSSAERDGIAIADHIVNLGPGAGTAGGAICFEGSLDGLLESGGTITGRRFWGPGEVEVEGEEGQGGDRRARRDGPQRAERRCRHHARRLGGGDGGGGRQEFLITGSVSNQDGVVTVDQDPHSRLQAQQPSNCTPGCSSRSARPSRRPTASSRRSSTPNSEGACPECNGAGVHVPTSA